MNQLRKQQIAGWIAVALSTMITCFWAFWGIIENFHEGWYYQSWFSNIGLMFLQYLNPMLIFMGVTIVSIYLPRLGAALHIIFALFLAWFFHAFTNTIVFFLLLPLVGFGLLYWVGRPQPRQRALLVAVGLPILTLIIAGISPAYRVSQRLNDGNFQARLVQGNGVTLTWAPAGPGWAKQGTTWHEAKTVCQSLNEDGDTLASELQYIWRLPTVDEAVRSMARHGENSQGVWDAGKATATYQTTPDKESPLWDVYSQLIYWWTATEVDTEDAYMIAYDGKVWIRSKKQDTGYLGFRCVMEV